MTEIPDPTPSPGYRLTDTAEAELEEILAFVAARDGMRRALRVHAKFAAALELLAFQPGSGRTRPKLSGERIRWWPIFHWIVIYDPDTAPISILRVIHGAREIDGILRPEECEGEE